MKLLERYANRIVLSELHAQKTANMRLAKALKFERNRANALQVSRKTANTKANAARKRVRELEAGLS